MSTEAVSAAGEGPLSVDNAIALLEATPKADVPVEPQEDEESEAEPTAEDAIDPEEVIEGEEDAEPESDPEAPVIAAPTSWDATERALFETLPTEAKQVIAAREAERDKAVSKAMQKA